MNKFFVPVLLASRQNQEESRESKIDSLSAQLFPAFQPVIEVASGKIHSYEALARSDEGEGLLISGGHYFTDPKIPPREKRELDRLLREKSLAAIDAMPQGTALNINISPQWITHLEQSESVPTLEMIERLDIDPQRVIVELTEFCGDMDRLLEVVNLYRTKGIRIAIDDFGAGFSQLDRVIALEPDIIKLDMQLFKQAAQGGIAETVVESLTRLATRCGAQIVCEGVETVEEFKFGLKCGARYMQGYLFSAATKEFLPVDHFSEQLAQLREEFFHERRQVEAEKINHIGRIKAMVETIKQELLLQDSNPLETLNTSHLSRHLLRFYICDRSGNQLTPNYNYDSEQQCWNPDTKQQGYNWAWRPYFYQLAALIPQQENRLVASLRYQDIATGAPCKTLATLLDPKRVLLVDVLAHWD